MKEEIKNLIKNQNLDIDLNQNEDNIIIEFKDKVDWYRISIYEKLSEPFIREFQDKIRWDCISEYQKLSESFIREFHDKIDWNNISHHQILSKPFIIEFKDKVDWVEINKNEKILKSPEFQDIINREILIQKLKK